MPKKRSRRPRRGDYVALILVVSIALVLAWVLFAPRAPHARRTIAALTPAPAASPPQATPEPSPPFVSTPSPAPSSTPAATPLPSPALRPALHGGGAKLAVIVDDCGQWIDTERGFLALDVPLTLSVLPDVHYTAAIAGEAASAGKGVMLHLPMETVSGLNPGPGKVTTTMTDAQIDAQVEADLAQVPLARGVNNHEGSKASADPRVMGDVIGILRKHGNLFFIDSRTSASSVGEKVAADTGVPTAARDVFLDNQATVAYTVGQLRAAAAIARRTGSAIAIGHPRPTTLEALKEEIPELQAAGIEFVLAQDLVSSDPK